MDLHMKVEAGSKNLFKGRFLSSKKVVYIFYNEKPFESDQKGFLFRGKNSFRSWDIYIFILNFQLCGKTAW